MKRIDIKHEWRGRKLKVFLWITTSTIVLLCLATIIVVIIRSMPPFSDSFTYDVYYRDNIMSQGTGTADGLSLSLHVLSVMAYKEDRGIAAKSPLSLLVDGKEYNIADITQATIQSIVGDGEIYEEYVDDRNILWVTIDNSESVSQIRYSLTFTLDNNKLSTIDLFQNSRTEVESKYRIVIDGQLLPALPTDHKEMEKILGEPISIEKQRKY